MTTTAGLHERVLEQLGPDLVWGDLRRSEDLRLELLEARYAVSRSVVREVVRVLESMGMVASRRRVGIRIRPQPEWHSLDPRLIRWRLAGPERGAQLRALTELRRGIEPVAAALAADRATPAQCGELTGAVIGMSVTGQAGDLQAYLQHDITFHRVLLEASGNEMFAALAGVVAEVLTGRTEHDLMPAHPEPAAIRLHGDVAEAVSARDAARAERAMRDIVNEAADAMEHGLAGTQQVRGINRE
ncbi:MAG TPA: FCD domain-containing protein [Marmoricola sp.]|nr:FCD domain-containing protein [Marmoricola sp.]